MLGGKYINTSGISINNRARRVAQVVEQALTSRRLSVQTPVLPTKINKQSKTKKLKISNNVGHAYSSNYPRRLRKEQNLSPEEFKASLGNIVRPHRLKSQTKPNQQKTITKM
jgi:hypothetical protein